MHNQPVTFTGGSVCDWKNTVTWFDAIVTDIFLEPVRDFLRQEGNLLLFSAFGVPDYSLPVFDILRSEFQDLANPHTRTGHELEYETIPGIWRPEDDFIDHILFQDFELDQLPRSEKLS